MGHKITLLLGSLKCAICDGLEMKLKVTKTYIQCSSMSSTV